MQATTIAELSPHEQAQAERAITLVVAAARQRGRPITAPVVEAVFLYHVMHLAADDVDWARHLLGLATAHRWPDFSDTLRRSGVAVN